MLKRTAALIFAVIISVLLASCGSENVTAEEEIDDKKIWSGVYVFENSDTEEFKVIRVLEENDTQVSLSFDSVRSKNDFTADFKSKSGKYAVCNTGERCLNIKLKSGNTVISVDDIWTDREKKRNENWSGKYVMLPEGEEPQSYGNSSWNGEYICDETGLEVSVYAIKDNIVLLTYPQTVYSDDGDEKTEKIDIKCLTDESDPQRSVFEDGGRRIQLELKASDKSIIIEDTFEDTNTNAAVISGSYKAYR